MFTPTHTYKSNKRRVLMTDSKKHIIYVTHHERQMVRSSVALELLYEEIALDISYIWEK